MHILNQILSMGMFPAWNASLWLSSGVNTSSVAQGRDSWHLSLSLSYTHTPLHTGAEVIGLDMMMSLPVPVQHRIALPIRASKGGGEDSRQVHCGRHLGWAPFQHSTQGIPHPTSTSYTTTPFIHSVVCLWAAPEGHYPGMIFFGERTLRTWRVLVTFDQEAFF